MRIAMIVSAISPAGVVLGYISNASTYFTSVADPELSFSDASHPFFRPAVIKSGSSTLSPRWRGTPLKATDEEWLQATCKGVSLHTMTYYNDHDAAQLLNPPKNTMASSYSHESLDDWGYTQVSGDQGPFDDDVFYGAAKLLKALHLSNRGTRLGGTWVSYEIRHGEFDEVDFGKYRVLNEVDRRKNALTGGKFDFAIDLEKGATLGLRFKSIKHAVQEYGLNIPDAELPDLRQASEVMWCMWQDSNTAGSSISKFLRHVIILSIINPETVAVLKTAMDKANEKLEAFPGTVFTERDGLGFLAVLGTPIAGMVVHFLLGVKEDTGVQAVESVYVFRCDNTSTDPCLLFNIGPVEQRFPDDDDGEYDPLYDDEEVDVDWSSANVSAVFLDRREEGNQILRTWRVDGQGTVELGA